MQHPKPLNKPEAAGDDAGFGLVEVLVAMLVFAIVAVSVAYSVTLTLTTTKDSKAREIALNLASAEIDSVRAIGDPFDVFSATSTVTQGETYTIQRVASWVSAAGADATCSASGGTLRYKRVNVTVTWTGMGPTGIAARADTLMAPTSRINDPAKGTIFISVLGANGLGLAGVTPTVSGTSSPPVEPTDIEGCSFVLGVTPGNYSVSLNLPNYVDTTHTQNSRVPVATGTLAVVAGASTSFQFQYDRAGLFPTRYATNRAALATTPNMAITFPPNLKTNFVSTLGVYPRTESPTESGSNPRVATLSTSTKLFPVQSGYQAFAGDYRATTPEQAGCEVADPAAWGLDNSTGVDLIGQRSQGQFAAPGATASPINVPMGIVQVARTASSNRNNLVAVQVTAPQVDGEPTCATSPLTIRFGAVFTNNNAIRIALPFGSWRLYATRQSTTSVPGSDATVMVQPQHVTVLSNVIPGRANADATGIITIDPRGITP
ncbi:type IV pilus modification PilV family protein [Agromyces protaetiae]|uniref:type IV pilus modification PilV family protein n=1 Tax=Agromyces protaetiae TaxID=2509455 RepID=UPI0013ED7C1D|nr:prepilin-type N-terminal cleavage/methylation domain-containing protein [Agromyces protaetiae]